MAEPFDPKKVFDALVAYFQERIKADPRYDACRSYDELMEFSEIKIMEMVKEGEETRA